MASGKEARLSRAERRAGATRREIVEAASRLFLAGGYVGTTIEAIAAEAGVAVQTIYNAVGSKRDVLSRVVDLAAGGKEEPIAVSDFRRQGVESDTNPERVVRRLVEFWLGLLPQTAAIFRVIREAAAVDPEVASLERERAERRLANYTEAAQQLAARGGLRDDLALGEAAAVIWTLGHPDVYRFLVLEQGWPEARYERWLEQGLRAQLLAS
jgi:AcrR family transcriptional regulator